MSFWVLSYFDCDDPHGSGPVGLYNTEDEAIMAAISSREILELKQTSDGTLWYYNRLMDEPIKLEKLKKKIRETGFLDVMNPADDFDIYKACYYYSIEQTGLSSSPAVTIQKVDKLEREVKCEYCPNKLMTDLYNPSENLCYGCKNPCMICGRRVGSIAGQKPGEWYCFKHSPQNCRPQTLNVIPYPSSGDFKGKGYQSKATGLVFIASKSEICAIGSDIQENGYLERMTPHQIASVPEDVKIDEGWRKGNKKPILFSDYLKMTSQEKN